MSSIFPVRLKRFRSRIGKVMHALHHPLNHARLRGDMQAARQHGVVSRDGPSFWKYLDVYLARSFSAGARARIMRHHYRVIARHIAPHARAGWQSGVTCWSSVGASGRDYRMTVGEARRAPMEGEAEIALWIDGDLLTTVTFAIAPASMFGLDGVHVMLVGGVQGMIGRREDNRTAARDHREVAPMALLLLAGRTLADALGIAWIVGVPCSDQVELAAHPREHAAYDRFWRDAGANEPEGGPFTLRVAGRADRSLTHLSPSHRARTRRKAAYKGELQAVLAGAMNAMLVSHPAPLRRSEIAWEDDPGSLPPSKRKRAAAAGSTGAIA